VGLTKVILQRRFLRTFPCMHPGTPTFVHALYGGSALHGPFAFFTHVLSAGCVGGVHGINRWPLTATIFSTMIITVLTSRHKYSSYRCEKCNISSCLKSSFQSPDHGVQLVNVRSGPVHQLVLRPCHSGRTFLPPNVDAFSLKRGHLLIELPITKQAYRLAAWPNTIFD